MDFGSLLFLCFSCWIPFIRGDGDGDGDGELVWTRTDGWMEWMVIMVWSWRLDLRVTTL